MIVARLGVAGLEREVEVAEVAQLESPRRTSICQHAIAAVEFEQDVAGLFDRLDDDEALVDGRRVDRWASFAASSRLTVAAVAVGLAEEVGPRSGGSSSRAVEVFEIPRPVVVVFVGVDVDELLEWVGRRVVPEDELVQIAEVHDERRHARHEQESGAGRDRFVAEEVEERQLR